MNELTNKLIIDKFRRGGNSRVQYLKAQNEYYRSIVHTNEIRNDPMLHDYRKKLRSEMQFTIIQNIHYSILSFALTYFIIRKLKSGYVSAVGTASAFSLFVLSSIYNTQLRYPFEIYAILYVKKGNIVFYKLKALN